MKKDKLFSLLCIFTLFFFFCSGEAPAEKIDRIAAIVNGDIITEEELNVFVKMASADDGLGYKGKTAQEIRQVLLGQMIEDRILLQEAKRQGIRAGEDVIEGRIREIKERAGSVAAFEQALREQGVSLAELREKLENQFLIYLVIQKEIKSKIQVNPKEVTEVYEKNKERFLTPESAIIDSIFVADAASLAEVQKRLAEGADFALAAKEFSKKSSLGRVFRGQLKKELEEAIFALAPGERSQVLPVDGGYFLFMLKEKMPHAQKSLDEVRDDIKAALEKEKTEKMLKGWLEALKDKAYISVRQ